MSSKGVTAEEFERKAREMAAKMSDASKRRVGKSLLKTCVDEFEKHVGDGKQVKNVDGWLHVIEVIKEIFLLED